MNEIPSGIAIDFIKETFKNSSKKLVYLKKIKVKEIIPINRESKYGLFLRSINLAETNKNTAKLIKKRRGFNPAKA